MGSNQSCTEINSSPNISNTLLRRNSSSFHNLYSFKKQHIHKKWKFYNQDQALSKFSFMESKIDACPSLLNISEVKHIQGQKGQFYVTALIQYPPHNLKKQIQERKKQYRTFDQNILWKCLRQIAQALQYLHRNDIDYFPQSSSQIFIKKGSFKIKDPSVLPSIKESPQFLDKSSISKKLSEIIISMGSLQFKTIQYLNLNKINLLYSIQLSNLLNKMHEGDMKLSEIIAQTKRERQISLYIQPILSKIQNLQQTKIQIIQKLDESGKITAKSSSDNICEPIIRIKNKNLRNKQSIRPKTIVFKQKKIQKQNIQQNANVRHSNQPGISFPKKVQVLRKTCASTSGNTSPKNSDPLETKKSQIIQKRNQEFIQKTGGSQYKLFNEGSQSLLESIIEDQESILLKESHSPVSGLVDQLDAIAEDFMRIQNCFIDFQRSQDFERVPRANSTIIQVSQQSQMTEESHEIIKHISHSSIFQEYVQKPVFIIEEYQGGSRYEGSVLNGVKNGFGKFFYEDGGSYEGEWKDGEIQGYGRLYYQSGNLAYEGYWSKGEFNGKGKIVNEKPQEIEGSFDFKDFAQIGCAWITYEGEFKNDHKNGKGELILSNGEKLVANWIENNVFGEGTFETLGRQIIKGVWQNNILTNAFI